MYPENPQCFGNGHLGMLALVVYWRVKILVIVEIILALLEKQSEISRSKVPSRPVLSQWRPNSVPERSFLSLSPG
jgi:hypothetical protein